MISPNVMLGAALAVISIACVFLVISEYKRAARASELAKLVDHLGARLDRVEDILNVQTAPQLLEDEAELDEEDLDQLPAFLASLFPAKGGGGASAASSEEEEDGSTPRAIVTDVTDVCEAHVDACVPAGPAGVPEPASATPKPAAHPEITPAPPRDPHEMKIDELKAHLRLLGQSATGSKDQLILRLVEARAAA